MKIKDLREAYDALTSGMLDTTDIEPYMETITEALQIAGVKLNMIEREQNVGRMEVAVGIKVRLEMGLGRKELSSYVNEVLDDYDKWFKNEQKELKEC